MHTAGRRCGSFSPPTLGTQPCAKAKLHDKQCPQLVDRQHQPKDSPRFPTDMSSMSGQTISTNGLTEISHTDISSMSGQIISTNGLIEVFPTDRSSMSG